MLYNIHYNFKKYYDRINRSGEPAVGEREGFTIYQITLYKCARPSQNNNFRSVYKIAYTSPFSAKKTNIRLNINMP